MRSDRPDTLPVMQLDRQYTDPRLVAIYDAENSGRQDIDFYLTLAAELSAEVIVDLGCGTGVLACDLASTGAGVTGVDPAAAMLDVARRRTGAELVTWIEGDATKLGNGVADLAIMTGHVAQVFVGDAEWDQVLSHLFRALRPGGRLTFETRNPDAAGWTKWTRVQTEERFSPDGAQAFLSWVEVTDVAGDIVRFDGHTKFEPGGESSVSASTLRFRTRADVVAALEAAGFSVENLWGDWDRSAVSPGSPELIFIAVKPQDST